MVIDQDGLTEEQDGMHGVLLVGAGVATGLQWLANVTTFCLSGHRFLTAHLTSRPYYGGSVREERFGGRRGLGLVHLA